MENRPITLSGEMGQFALGMRSKFFEVVNQGEVSARLADIQTLFGSISDVSPLFTKINAVGYQKIELTGITGAFGYLEPTGELEPYKETGISPTYVTSIQAPTFTQRIRISKKAYEKISASYRQAIDLMRNLLANAARTFSMHSFDLFNNLRTDPASLPVHLFAYGDGVKIASVAHPLKNGETLSNCLSDSPALSHAALKRAILLGQNMKDDTGKPSPFFNGKFYIVANPARAADIFEILNTQNVPYTANFIANVFQSSQGYGITSSYIKNELQWTIVDGMFSPLVQVIFKDVTADEWVDENVKAYVVDVEAEWRIGTRDFRGLVHSVGNGSTISD